MPVPTPKGANRVWKRGHWPAVCLDRRRVPRRATREGISLEGQPWLRTNQEGRIFTRLQFREAKQDFRGRPLRRKAISHKATIHLSTGTGDLIGTNLSGETLSALTINTARTRSLRHPPNRTTLGPHCGTRTPQSQCTNEIGFFTSSLLGPRFLRRSLWVASSLGQAISCLGYGPQSVWPQALLS